MNEYMKMLKQLEFRKQTEEAKFEAFSLMCKKVAELEAENAELKTRVENQKSFLERIRAKFELDEIDRKEIEGYLESEQLTEAKELIKRLLATPRSIYGRDEDGELTSFFNPDYEELKKQAEQFLNSEVEK